MCSNHSRAREELISWPNRIHLTAVQPPPFLGLILQLEKDARRPGEVILPPRNTLLRKRPLCACMMLLCMWPVERVHQYPPMQMRTHGPSELRSRGPSETSTTSQPTSHLLPSQLLDLSPFAVGSVRMDASRLRGHSNGETQSFMDWMRSTYGIASLDNGLRLHRVVFEPTGLAIWALATFNSTN